MLAEFMRQNPRAQVALVSKCVDTLRRLLREAAQSEPGAVLAFSKGTLEFPNGSKASIFHEFESRIMGFRFHRSYAVLPLENPARTLAYLEERTVYGHAPEVKMGRFS